MTYIFDIDGTLADLSHRFHYLVTPSEYVKCEGGYCPNWDAFYKECVNDKPILPTLFLAKILKDANEDLIFVTGRPEKYMGETMDWLCKYLDTNCVTLMMRENGDHREDYVVKKEIYEKYIKPYYNDIDGVFEDRKQCVDMLRSLGFTCYQVADGNY